MHRGVYIHRDIFPAWLLYIYMEQALHMRYWIYTISQYKQFIPNIWDFSSLPCYIYTYIYIYIYIYIYMYIYIYRIANVVKQQGDWIKLFAGCYSVTVYTIKCNYTYHNSSCITDVINGFLHERRNSGMLAVDLRLSCINTSIWINECTRFIDTTTCDLQGRAKIRIIKSFLMTRCICHWHR